MSERKKPYHHMPRRYDAELDSDDSDVVEDDREPADNFLKKLYTGRCNKRPRCEPKPYSASCPEKKPAKPSCPEKKPLCPEKKPSCPEKKPSCPEKKPSCPRAKPSCPRPKRKGCSRSRSASKCRRRSKAKSKARKPRSRNPFIIFFLEMLYNQSCKVRVAAIAKEAAMKWSELSDCEKAVYRKMAVREQLRQRRQACGSKRKVKRKRSKSKCGARRRPKKTCS